MNILMAAAENDAFVGGKVGGIGDVLRDIPIALADIEQKVDVVIPSYGRFAKLSDAKHITSISVNFAGHLEQVDVFEIDVPSSSRLVTQWVLEHPLFAIGGEGKIYCNDPSDRPFATDATKFALFSAAVAKALISDVFGNIDAIHIHDWHAAVISVLRAFDDEYQALKSIQCVYTIHNLALQGIRPFDGDESSLKAWFPALMVNDAQIKDPRYHNCFNPVRAGINLSDKVHAVSPTYAKEILLPSCNEQGYFGGEGLEADLQDISNSGKLHGILNGCEYSDKQFTALDFNALLTTCENAVLTWISDAALLDQAHLIAITRLKQLLNVKRTEKPLVLTSVGRITAQKVLILQQKMANGQTALSHLLQRLGDQGVFILLGSGDAQLESFLTNTAAEHSNFVFLKGYSESLSDNIYSSGDLFIMPSSFEPCGISQMLSMRAGQPCLAHSVGGLADTIMDDTNGFTFTGSNIQEQADNMLNRFSLLLENKKRDAKAWVTLGKNASKARFLWKEVAQDYVKYLYNQ